MPQPTLPATGGAVAPELLAALEGWRLDLQGAMRDEMRGLHLELIRELDAQRHEMRAMLDEGRAESAALREEIGRLREENARLRGPLGLGVLNL